MTLTLHLKFPVASNHFSYAIKTLGPYQRKRSGGTLQLHKKRQGQKIDETNRICINTDNQSEH